MNSKELKSRVKELEAKVAEYEKAMSKISGEAKERNDFKIFREYLLKIDFLNANLNKMIQEHDNLINMGSSNSQEKNEVEMKKSQLSLDILGIREEIFKVKENLHSFVSVRGGFDKIKSDSEKHKEKINSEVDKWLKR